MHLHLITFFRQIFDVRSKKLFPDLLSGKSFPDQNESTNRNYLLLLHIIVWKNVVPSVALMYFSAPSSYAVALQNTHKHYVFPLLIFPGQTPITSDARCPCCSLRWSCRMRNTLPSRCSPASCGATSPDPHKPRRSHPSLQYSPRNPAAS